MGVMYGGWAGTGRRNTVTIYVELSSLFNYEYFPSNDYSEICDLDHGTI